MPSLCENKQALCPLLTACTARRLHAQGAKPALGSMVLPCATPSHRKSLVAVDSPAGRELAEARGGGKQGESPPETATPIPAHTAAPWMVQTLQTVTFGATNPCETCATVAIIRARPLQCQALLTTGAHFIRSSTRVGSQGPGCV